MCVEVKLLAKDELVELVQQTIYATRSRQCRLLLKTSRPNPTVAQRYQQIPCSGCEKTYTGQTGRLLGTRLKEHRGSVRRHDTNLCLALHCMDTGHTFNWQDTHILGSANSQRAREAIEENIRENTA